MQSFGPFVSPPSASLRSARCIGVLAGVLTLACSALPAKVVLSEIFYHPPLDRGDLEYIEIWNTGDQTVDTGGWELREGVRFRFPAEIQLAAGAFAVIARDPEAFRAEFGDAIAVLGEYDGALDNSSDTIALVDAAGQEIERVTYTDRAPWPVSADGLGSSLERLAPTADAESASSWLPSRMPRRAVRSTGSPGARGTSAPEGLPPVVDEVSTPSTNPAPGDRPIVSARVSDPDRVEGVSLVVSTLEPGAEWTTRTVPMERADGDARSGRYSARVPAQKDGTLVRLVIEATDAKGHRRRAPHRNDLRPAYSFVVRSPTDATTIPQGFVISTHRVSRARQRASQLGRRSFLRPSAFAQRILSQKLPLAKLFATHFSDASLSFDPPQALEVYQKHARSQREWLDSLDAKPARNPNELSSEIDARVEAFLSDLASAIGPDTEPTAAERLRTAQRTSAERASRETRYLLRSFDPSLAAYFALTQLDLSPKEITQFKELFPEIVASFEALAESSPYRNRDVDSRKWFGDIARFGENSVDKCLAAFSDENTSRFEAWYVETFPSSSSSSRGRFSGPGTPQSARGGSAFVWVAANGKTSKTYDFVRVDSRSGGFKVRFHKDFPLAWTPHQREEASDDPVPLRTINLIFEENSRFVLAEPMAYEVYRRAGVPTPTSGHLRLTIDGNPRGYHLLVEQPNRSFLRRTKLDPDGDLFKLIWYGKGVVGQHERKTNLQRGHEQIVEAVEKLDGLSRLEPAVQDGYIDATFDAEEFASYFAVNALLSNWDGFHNNYFVYREPGDAGRWQIFPWDEDKTWGYHDGTRRSGLLVDMPLTFGSDLDKVPGDPTATFERSRYTGQGPTWWRAPGHFSGPLLANASFRARYLKRTKALLDTVFAEEVVLPLIAEMERRLEPEVRFRAEALGEDADRSRERLRSDVESLREFFRRRRQYLTAQPEMRADS